MQNHLEAWRASRGWTMEETAKALGNATASQVNKLEKGKQKLTQSWLDRYARAFGVTVQAILGPPDAGHQTAVPTGPDPATFDEEAFIAAIKAGLAISGVTISRAEEMVLVGNALKMYERIVAGADPAQLLAELLKADDAAAGKTSARR